MKFKKIISAVVGAAVIYASLPFSSTVVDFSGNTLKSNAEDIYTRNYSSVSTAEITIGTVTVKGGKTVDVPVTISGNSGFSDYGFVFNFDSRLSLNGIEKGIVGSIGSLVNSERDNSVSVTFANDENITADGVIFTFQFKLPDSANNDDVFKIIGSIDSFHDESGKSLPLKIKNGAVKVASNITTTTAITTTATVTTELKLGDINGDNKIDSKDAVLVLKYYAECLAGNASTNIPLEKGDINGDGKIDSKDAVKILKYYAQTMVGYNVNIKDV